MSGGVGQDRSYIAPVIWLLPVIGMAIIQIRYQERIQFEPEGVGVLSILYLFFCVVLLSVCAFNILALVCVYFSSAERGIRVLPVFLYCAMMIVLFGCAYGVTGIVDSNSNFCFKFLNCLYFSVVCWTTLGFGDFVPAPYSRGFAAVEALFGYMSVGIVVAITLDYFSFLGWRR